MSFPRRVFLTRSVVALLAVLFLTSFQTSEASMGEAKYVDVDGIKTRYFEGGTGVAMVLVHGGPSGSAASSAMEWMPIFPSLARHFHVYAVDMLGMGLTDKPGTNEEYPMQATAEHLHRFMETLGIDQVHLVGHSRGALPGARVAIDHPETVKTLTLFDSNTLAPGEDPPPPATPGPRIRSRPSSGGFSPDRVAVRSLLPPAALMTQQIMLVWPAFLVFFLSHGISFVYHFIGKQEFLRMDPEKQTIAPYKRVAIMQVTIIGGACVIQFLGAPVLALVLLISSKIAIDAGAHRSEHLGFV